MKTVRVLSIIAIFFVITPLLYGQEWQTMKCEIIDFDTMDGHPGYYHTMTINDTLHETDFFFEEGEYIRWYAFKMYYQSSFYILPDSTYITKIVTV